MPVYTYRREDGELIEVRQKFEDEPLTHDPETGQAVQRVISPVQVLFNSDGFYVTDNASAKNPAGSS